MLTVFTAAVYPDVARLWYECVTRAFPVEHTVFEIFDDSDNTLDAAWFPRATVLRQNRARRDFQESYNDAIHRARTPYLAFIDSDIFWISPDLWTARIEPELGRPGMAAISCVSRRHRPSHGTFAVVCDVAAYRKVMERLPGGFLPVSVRCGPDVPMSEWVGYDTGDRITDAVREAGFGVELRHLDDDGTLVRFESVTMYRRIAERVSARPMTSMMRNANWLWRGCVCSMVLERLHNRLFPRTPFHAQRLSGMLGVVRGMGSRWPRGLRFIASRLRSARRLERFLKSAPSPWKSIPHTGNY
jgi:glycosyltransferase involved in cell wall biosynthesis